MDTRAYHFLPLKKNQHTLFELDFPIINQYKESILKDEKPLCKLIRLSTDLSDPKWRSNLIKSGYSSNIPTFWVLEGLIYYMEQSIVSFLLIKVAEISAEKSQIFADICMPILAKVKFGPFIQHFKWGFEKNAVPEFFASAGWNVSAFWADDHDQGRDIRQKGLIFIHGINGH